MSSAPSVCQATRVTSGVPRNLPAGDHHRREEHAAEQRDQRRHRQARAGRSRARSRRRRSRPQPRASARHRPARRAGAPPARPSRPARPARSSWCRQAADRTLRDKTARPRRSRTATRSACRPGRSGFSVRIRPCLTTKGASTASARGAAQQQHLPDRIGRDQPFPHHVVEGEQQDAEQHHDDAGQGGVVGWAWRQDAAVAGISAMAEPASREQARRRRGGQTGSAAQ